MNRKFSIGKNRYVIITLWEDWSDFWSLNVRDGFPIVNITFLNAEIGADFNANQCDFCFCLFGFHAIIDFTW